MTNFSDREHPRVARHLPRHPRHRYALSVVREPRNWRWLARELVKAIDAQQAQRGKLVQFRPRRVEPDVPKGAA